MLEGLTEGTERRNLFYQIRRDPTQKEGEILSKDRQLEENTSAAFGILLEDSDPVVGDEIIELFCSELGVTKTDKVSFQSCELEYDITDDVPDEMYLIGVAETVEQADLNVDELPKKQDNGWIDALLRADINGRTVGFGVEVKTGSGELSDGQMGKYATALDPAAAAAITWKQVYQQLKAQRPLMIDEYDPNARTPYLFTHFLEYMEITELASTAHTNKTVHSRGDGRDEIRVEYHESPQERVEVHFLSESFENADDDGIDDRTFPWDAFDDLMMDVEQRYGTEFLRRMFVYNPEGGRDVSCGSEAVADEVGDDLIIGEIPGVRTNPGNYLRFYYRGDVDRLELREVQPASDGSSPDKLGRPAGGNEFYNWMVTGEEFDALLSQDHVEGFSQEFREMLFVERNRESVKKMVVSE